MSETIPAIDKFLAKQYRQEHKPTIGKDGNLILLDRDMGVFELFALSDGHEPELLLTLRDVLAIGLSAVSNVLMVVSEENLVSYVFGEDINDNWSLINTYVEDIDIAERDFKFFYNPLLSKGALFYNDKIKDIAIIYDSHGFCETLNIKDIDISTVVHVDVESNICVTELDNIGAVLQLSQDKKPISLMQYTLSKVPASISDNERWKKLIELNFRSKLC